MQRIVILGGCGCGKSTLARLLGARLDLPVVHLDGLNFDPGWAEVDAPTFQARMAEALAGDRWVSDGNYTSKAAEARLRRADTILWLDQPRWKRMLRVIRRIVFSYGRTRPDMAEGCPERLDLAFLKWTWRWDQDQRPKTLARVLEGALVPIVTLRGNEEIAAFIARLPHQIP